MVRRLTTPVHTPTALPAKTGSIPPDAGNRPASGGIVMEPEWRACANAAGNRGQNRSAVKGLPAQQRERGLVTYGCRAWLRRSLKQEARKKMAAPKGRPFLFAFCPPPGAAAIFSGLRTPPDLLPASAILPTEAARSPRAGGSPAYCSPASTTPDNGEPPPGPHTYKSFHGPGRRSGTPAYRGG